MLRLLVLLLLAVAAPAHAATDTLVVETDWGAAYALWHEQGDANGDYTYHTVFIQSTIDADSLDYDSGVLVKTYENTRLVYFEAFYDVAEETRSDHFMERRVWVGGDDFTDTHISTNNYLGDAQPKWLWGVNPWVNWSTPTRAYCWELLLVRNMGLYDLYGYAPLQENADVLPFKGLYGQCGTNYATSIRPSSWGHIKRKARTD